MTMKRRNVLAGALGGLAWPWSAGLPAAVSAGLVAGCGGGTDGGTRLRLLNASKGYGSLDLYIDGDDVEQGIGYGQVSGYAGVDGGDTYTLSLSRNGSGTYVYRAEQSLSNRKSHTLVAYGAEGSLGALLVKEDEDEDDIDSGDARLQILNVATDAGTLDVYLTGEDDSLTDAIALATDVAVLSGGASSPLGYLDLNKGTYRLRVTGADDKADLRLDVGGLTLGDRQVASLVLTGSAGGVLVDGLLLLQEGELQALPNPSARLRVVAGVTANAVVNAAVGAVPLMGGVAAPTVGTYVLVPAGNVTPTVSVNGVAVAASAVALTAGGDHTLLVYGDAAAPLTSALVDDNRLPASASKCRMRLVNAVAGLAAPLTLTLNFGAVASSVAAGTGSAYSDQSATTDATLDVTAPGVGTLFSRSELTLQANAVYSVFMLGAAGSPAGQLLLERVGGSTASAPVPAATGT